MRIIKKSEEGREKMIDKNSDQFDGYISKWQMPNRKVYKFQCEVVEVYPMQCPRCGGKLELRYGNGECQSCGTAFTTKFKITEAKE